jgi:hypothetical protein
MPESSAHPLRRALYALVAALFAVVGLTFIAASPASAHTPLVSVTCDTLHVAATSYSGSADNRLTVTIDGTKVENSTKFGDSISKDYPFSNRAAAHSYTVHIQTSDDPDGTRGYTVTENGTSTPCLPAAPSVSVAATQCSAPGDTTGDLVATITGVQGRSYTASVQQAGSKTAIQTVPVTSGHASFSGLATGKSYTVTVTDTAAAVSTTSDAVALTDCPVPNPTVTASVQQCTVPGGDEATITAQLGTTDGRDYSVELIPVGGGSPLDSREVTSDSVEFTGLSTGEGYIVRVTDVASGVHTDSSPVTLEPCPTLAPTVTTAVATCTPDSGSVDTVTATVAGEEDDSFDVSLLNKAGDVVSTKTVDGPGDVTFDKLSAGDGYTVKVVDTDADLTVTSDAITVAKCETATTPPTTTPAATPAATPTPIVTAESHNLAETGFLAAPVAFGAIAALLAGMVGLVLRRRHQTR